MSGSNRLFPLSSGRGVALIAIALLTGSLAGCGDDFAPPADASVPPRQAIVAVDLSGSLTPEELRRHQQLVGAVIEGLSFDDRLVLLAIRTDGARDDSRTWKTIMPGARNPSRPLSREERQLEQAKAEAHDIAGALFRSPPAPGTDIFATLHAAADFIREAGESRPSLLILSDMLQCTGGVCMENAGGVPGESWIERQQERGLLPSLDGVCVSIVGGDASTPQGVNVRDFWGMYLTQAGARFDVGRYRYQASSVRSLEC